MKKVLVVDDDEDVLLLIRILLDRHGFLVELLSSSTFIQKKIREFEPGLIILDVNLQDGDGRVICKELKENPLTQHIPIILFSSDHNIIKDFKEYHADNFIGKPFEANKLVDHANKYFAKLNN